MPTQIIGVPKDGHSGYVPSDLADESAASSGITVSFLKPSDWGSSGVNIWAWTGVKNDLFESWPGVAMTERT
ncbi:MAG TPA: starch-binding protein, partial [Brumimicrobium sp.]|nr:starch-binding protein [Brumimicrobium sp.]